MYTWFTLAAFDDFALKDCEFLKNQQPATIKQSTVDIVVTFDSVMPAKTLSFLVASQCA